MLGKKLITVKFNGGDSLSYEVGRIYPDSGMLVMHEVRVLDTGLDYAVVVENLNGIESYTIKSLAS